MGINVLSCFDGISCGQLALQRAGIEVDNYFASEIDKYAIKVTQTRFPKTVQLGDINNWKNWQLPKIDLIIAGSPCQGFSLAGKRLNFEDPRSKLFFVFCDLLAVYYEKNPDLKYLLENVKMKKEWREIITDRMKVEPVLINSALVSAQNRERLYWANWEFGQPEDKHIYLKDIIEYGDVDRNKSYCIDSNYYKGGNPRSYFEDGKRQLVFKHQSHRRAMVKTIGHGYIKESEKESDKYPSLCAQSPASKHLIRTGTAGDVNGNPESEIDIREKSKTVRVGGRGSPVGSKQEWDLISSDGYRKLTVLECERLQTLGDGYTDCGISNTQRYKCIGNGWTVDVVENILFRLKTSDFFQLSGEIKMNKAVILGRRLDKNGHRQDYNKNIPITQCIEVRETNTNKSNCLTTVEKDNVLTPLPVGRHADVFGRKLPFRYYSLREYCSLQTIPKDYFSEVSDATAKKLIGNGWTIDVIAHILSALKLHGVK